MSAVWIAALAFSLGTCLGSSLMLLVTRRHRLEPEAQLALPAAGQLPARSLLVIAACAASASAATVFYLSATR